MLLQLALDDPAGFSVLPLVRDLVDIVEVGTPLLKRFGTSAITAVRETAPGVAVLADTKTVDAGALEAEMVFGAGARFMTVLSCASAATMTAVAQVAERRGCHIVVDTLTERSIAGVLAHEYPAAVAYLSLHSPTDVRLAGDDSTDTVIGMAAEARRAGWRISLAGGIDRSSLPGAVAAGPDVIVVGGAITSASDPRGTTEWMRHQLKEAGHGWPSAMS
jgi:3-hexulose-6-phosphate synthase